MNNLKNSFVEKYKVSETTILQEMKDMGKHGYFHTAFENLTKDKATLSDEIAFLSLCSAQGLKIRPKMFPEFTEGEKTVVCYPQPTKKLKVKGVDSLKTIVSDDDLCPNLCSVYFENGNMIATDAHKLVITKQTETDSEIIEKLILANYKYTKKSVATYTMDEAKEYVNKALNGKLDGKMLDFGNGSVVNGNYPQYKEVIPEPTEGVKTNIQKLIDIANGANMVKQNLLNTMFHLSINIPFDVWVNPEYLLQTLLVLQANGANEIEIMCEGETKPILIKTDNGQTGLVMPVYKSSVEPAPTYVCHFGVSNSFDIV